MSKILEALQIDTMETGGISPVVETDRFKLYKPEDYTILDVLMQGAEWWTDEANQYYDPDRYQYAYRYWEPRAKFMVLIDKQKPKNNPMLLSDSSLKKGNGKWVSGSTYIYNSGDVEIARYFVNNKVPYIATYLQRKFADKLYKVDSNDKFFHYPEDLEKYPKEARRSLNFDGIKFAEGTKIIKGLSGINLKDGVGELIIPEGVTKISRAAFKSSRIRKIVLPDSVTDIGSAAFAYCWDLQEIKLSKNLKNLGDETFYYTKSLKSIELPDGLLSIGKSAFYYADIKEIKLPNSVVSIGAFCFGYSSLEKIELSSNLSTLPEYCFNSSHIESMNIPRSVTKILDGCFYNCKSLQKIFIPSSVQEICGMVFQNCNINLQINFEDTQEQVAEKIRGNANRYGDTDGNQQTFTVQRREWSGYNSYTHQTIYNYTRFNNIHYGVKPPVSEALQIDINHAAPPLYKDEYWEVYYPKDIADISEISPKLIAKSKKDQEEAERSGWRGTYENELERYLGRYYFKDIKNNKVYLYDATNRWNNIKDEEGKAALPEYWGNNTNEFGFKYSNYTAADNLVRFLDINENTEGLTKWCAKKWKNDSTKKYLQYLEALEQYKKSNGVLKYKSKLYNEIATTPVWASDEKGILKNLTWKIEFPKDITEISEYAFDYFKNLKSIRIPETVTKINNDAFRGCYQLEEVILPEGLKEIGNDAFAYTKLKEIYIPKSVEILGKHIFYGLWHKFPIKCGASEKPSEWNPMWNMVSESSTNGRDTSTYNKQIYWGVKPPITEDLEIDSIDVSDGISPYLIDGPKWNDYTLCNYPRKVDGETYTNKELIVTFYNKNYWDVIKNQSTNLGTGGVVKTMLTFDAAFEEFLNFSKEGFECVSISFDDGSGYITPVCVRRLNQEPEAEQVQEDIQVDDIDSSEIFDTFILNDEQKEKLLEDLTETEVDNFGYTDNPTFLNITMPMKDYYIEALSDMTKVVAAVQWATVGNKNNFILPIFISKENFIKFMALYPRDFNDEGYKVPDNWDLTLCVPYTYLTNRLGMNLEKKQCYRPYINNN